MPIVNNSKIILPIGETCVIFDELQDCPGARASLKFWRQDGRYDVICTGSLLGVNGYGSDEDYSIPVGAENIVDMFPMDFEEWLWANKMPHEAIEMLRTHYGGYRIVRQYARIWHTGRHPER